MAKLTVKNVGPIREAEFEVKKHTVFIGPQGSGKSTLAKLIAIGGDIDLLPLFKSRISSLPENYGMINYIKPESYIWYRNNLYHVGYKSGFNFSLEDVGKISLDSAKNQHPDVYISSFDDQVDWYNTGMAQKPPFALSLTIGKMPSILFYEDFLPNEILRYSSLYFPSERNLTSTLNDAIWSLIYSDINLPRMVTQFGRHFEEARNTHNQLDIQFLKVNYVRKGGQDFVEYQPGQFIKLSESASGYQSIIPLLLVVEYQRQQDQRRFIIEEPELNLYPIAQKDLIYALMSGLDPNVEYQDAEWVITTHSPYVLSSFNTLMLAYKVAQKSDELRAEVEKLVPARCWINPDEFAAYYVDNGTVESITNPETGLINDSRLDDVSEDFAGEQDALFDLYRTARVND